MSFSWKNSMTRRTLASSRCSVSTEWSDGCRTRELDGDERVTEQFAQRFEPVAHQSITAEAQAEHLTARAPHVRPPPRHRPGERPRSAPRAEPIAAGNDGCDSTGAIMMSSTIIPSAKPPE